MKKILTILLLSVSSIACSYEDTSNPTSVANVDQLVTKAKRQQTCIMVWDSKQNKEIKKCKTIKIHKKYEGTAIPSSSK